MSFSCVIDAGSLCLFVSNSYMASPELLKQLPGRNLQASMLLYSATSVCVYRGEYLSGGQRYPTAIKLIEYQLGNNSGLMEREINSMLALQHPNIVKLYDSALMQVGVKYYHMIAMELCDRSLEKDNNERRKNNYYWEEEKLWEVIRKLVSAFAYMQERGFAHRDVKPMNIFLKQQEPLIGDFGSGNFADFTNPYLQSTLVGTPIYMSPLQRTAFCSRTRTLTHNAFKSDVFSLGLTFYSMASLNDSAGMVAVTSFPQSLFAGIDVLQYSDVFKGLLRWMLAWEEDQRCDFVALHNWLNAPAQPAPPEINVLSDTSAYYTGQLDMQVVDPPTEYVYTNAQIPESIVPFPVETQAHGRSSPIYQLQHPSHPEPPLYPFEVRPEEAEYRKEIDDRELFFKPLKPHAQKKEDIKECGKKKRFFDCLCFNLD